MDNHYYYVIRYFLVVEGIGIIKNVQNQLDNVFCEIGSMNILRKLLKVIEKNIGFETIININDIYRYLYRTKKTVQW